MQDLSFSCIDYNRINIKLIVVMNIDLLTNKIRYVTDEEGQKTDVLIPLRMWENILQVLNTQITEENENKAELIADLKQSLLDAQKGKTYPLEELWQGIE